MKCVLIGNQNCGKTLLFNTLTGLNQKVGNWAGVTVEKKEGIIKNSDILLTDLPGVYSLSPYSSEEKITRDYILNENYDLIINIIDSTSIERSLYLTTELLELNKEVLVVLNMEDILEKKGYHIDIDKLSKKLNIKICSVSALKKTGINELINTIKYYEPSKKEELKIFPNDIEEKINLLSNNLKEDITYKRFISSNILSKDFDYVHYLKEDINYLDLIKEIENNHSMEADELIAFERYNFIENLRNECVKKVKDNSLSKKIDKILLHKYASIPIFIIIMSLIFTLSVGIIGGLTVNLVDAFFNGASEGFISLELFGYQIGKINSNFEGIGPLIGDAILNAGGYNWAASIFRDGIITGIGAVLNFVPQLIILFALLALLETSGYMSRITFLFDNFFRKIGLSGKALVSFIVGVGCTVPAISSTRTIEESKEKKLTILLTPFIPCNAKLPIIATICGSFFGNLSLLVTVLMYFLSIGMIILVGYFINKIYLKNKSNSFINELPDYHIPSTTYILRNTLEKTWDFIKRAGSIILLCSIFVWFLSSFTYKFEYIEFPSGLDESGNIIPNVKTIEDSLLAYIGQGISWIFYPMVGIGHSYTEIWGVSVSAIQGLIAKEQVISSMEIIAKVESGGNIFSSAMFDYLNPVTAFAYMSFVLFSAPCFGAIAAMKSELGSYKSMFKAIGIETFISWSFATLIGIIGGILTVTGVF